MEDRTGERTTLRRPSRRWIPIVAALLALAAAAYWLLRPGEPRRTARSVSTTDPAAAPPAAVTPPPVAPPVPQAAAEDARPLLESASSHPLYRRALAGAGDLPRRCALLLDLVARGDSPRKALAALAPSQPFSVARRDGRTVIAAASYARYDAFADAVASVDAAAVARAYRALHGVLENAYRALGYPDAPLDDVTARALRRVIAAPVTEGEVEVFAVEGLWRFADPALEDRDEVDKHLLRLGPRNVGILQAKARELVVALKAAPTGASP